MPYEAKQNGENWEVINKETGDVKAVHEPPEAEEKAKRQVHLLTTMEDHEGWDD